MAHAWNIDEKIVGARGFPFVAGFEDFLVVEILVAGNHDPLVIFAILPRDIAHFETGKMTAASITRQVALRRMADRCAEPLGKHGMRQHRDVTTT